MALPDYTFLEGFDKYVRSSSIANMGATQYSQLLTAGEWTSVGGSTTVYPAAALSGTGFSLRFISTTAGSTNIYKSLPANYARCLGGVTTQSRLGPVGVQFMDGASTTQVNLCWNSSGKLEARRGLGGTLLGTSVASYSDLTNVCVEWDITFHASAGIIKVWLNGALDSGLNLTGLNTAPSGNAYFNTFGIVANGAQNSDTKFDHLYLWGYTASGGSETPALTNPVIETSYVTSQASAAWSPGPSILGEGLTQATNGNTNFIGANVLSLRKVVANVSGNLDSIVIVTAGSNSTAKFKAVLYADNAGVPGALIQAGTEVVGSVDAVPLALPMGSSLAITGGTTYWIGYMTDTNLVLQRANNDTDTYRLAATYSSGAPSSAASATPGYASAVMFGLVSGIGSNWDQVSHAMPTAGYHYNLSATVNQQDLYGFNNLSFTPSAVYTVAVKAMVGKTDTGTRTINLLTTSGATTSTGSNSGFSLSTTDLLYASYFNTDPNTGAAWTPAALNAATHGIKLAS